MKAYLILLIQTGIQFICCASIPPIDKIASCVETFLKNKNYKKTTAEGDLIIDYEPFALENVGALTLHEMKQVDFLAQCVRLHADPNYFAVSDRSNPLYYQYGGSNVTYLTGILPSVLPDLSNRLVQIFHRLLRKWNPPDKIKPMGIRAIYYTSFELGKYNIFLQEHLKKEFPEHPIPDSLKVSEKDESTVVREAVRKVLHGAPSDLSRLREQFVSRPVDTEYVLMSLLSDREVFFGGDYLIRKHGRELRNPNWIDEFEDYDEDEDEPSLPVIELAPDPGALENKAKSVHWKMFEHLTPEKGSVTLIPGEFVQGLDEILCGTRRAFVVEFWNFNDAPAQPGIASHEMGVKLGIKRGDSDRAEL